MMPTEPYDQRRKDPASFYFSLALLAGLFTLSMIFATQWGWAIIGLGFAVTLAWRAHSLGRIADERNPG